MVTCVEDVIIEPESPEDRDAITAVVRRAFERQPAVADMVTAIRRSPRYRPGLAFVAHSASEPVGFVMLSGTDLVDQNGDRREVLTLTPLAVIPDHQHRGIGSALVRAALHAAERLGEPLVVLEGSPRYYGRLGFRFAGDHGITIDLPEWAPCEAAQVFLLKAYDPAVQGHVEYPSAIADVTG
jgi:putative acetyltransferase